MLIETFWLQTILKTKKLPLNMEKKTYWSCDLLLASYLSKTQLTGLWLFKHLSQVTVIAVLRETTSYLKWVYLSNQLSYTLFFNESWRHTISTDIFFLQNNILSLWVTNWGVKSKTRSKNKIVGKKWFKKNTIILI